MNREQIIRYLDLYCLSIILLLGCGSSVWADTTSDNFLNIQNYGSALIPGHNGTDYIFTGNYSDGQVTITGPGEYYLTDNLMTSSPEFAIQIEVPDVILDGFEKSLTGAGGSGIGVIISTNGSSAVVTNFSSVSGFYRGIRSDGESVAISDNLVHNNTATGIQSFGDYAVINGNFVYFHGDVGIHSWGHNSTVSGNFALFNRDGILSQGNYADISGNAAIINNNTGIYGGGQNVGPEPGTEGHGYYARITDNVAILNSKNGIYSWLPHAIIEENSVFQNGVSGIGLSVISNNTTLQSNYVSNNPVGITLTDQALNVSIIRNLIRSEGNSGIFVRPCNGRGTGVIYDNIFDTEEYVNGTGKFGKFSWTNPVGPAQGTNIMNGPYIAGNYWTNPNRTGWSDIQEPTPSGYSATSYEVLSGSRVYDTAPLIRVGDGFTISASDDDWSIIYPSGTHAYHSGSNSTYITQAKPGADLLDVIVDSTSHGSKPAWTFSNIMSDHEISTVGAPIPGLVHVLFNTTPRTGQSPLTVSFTDQSYGSPCSWFWQFGDGAVSTLQNPSHVYASPGVYTVTLRCLNNENGGYGVWNKCITVTNGAEPTPTPVPGEIIPAFLASPVNGTAPLTVQFTDGSAGNPTAWYWDFGDGGSSTLQNPSYQYVKAGRYSVTLLAKNEKYGGSVTKDNGILVS